MNEKYLATRMQRFLAYLLDVIPLTVLAYLLYMIFGGVSLLESLDDRATYLSKRNVLRFFVFVAWVIICIFTEASSWQGSWGKKIMGFKIVDADGQPPSMQVAMTRNLFKIVSYTALFIRFLAIFFDRNRRGWHDHVAKTYAVKADYVAPAMSDSVEQSDFFA